jgi:glucan phosphoethanolaminetransferase (alkaline phosphatase superfamily)
MNILADVIERTILYADVILISAMLMALGWYFLLTRRRYLPACALLGLSLTSFLFMRGFTEWISGLGADSFLELSDFNMKEARFWIATFLSSASLMKMPMSKTMYLLLAQTMSASLLLYFAIKVRKESLHAVALVIGASVVYAASIAYGEFQSGRRYIEALKSEFDTDPSGFTRWADDIDLFIYIGESISTLNLSLYGYPLPTTPRLDYLYRSDEGFLRYVRVRSTHTHTSPSLLRALAVTSPEDDVGVRQWGIAGVLKSTGIVPTLHSVQPLTGSWATFARFVFDGLDLNVNPDDRYKGDLAVPTRKDHELLETALEEPGVVFFQSYAGHGPYLDFIEVPMSDSVQMPSISFRGVYGRLFSPRVHSALPRGVDDHHRAITYIDRNVARAIEAIKSRNRPAVLIYFSDHGESVYTGRSHDSSKFIDEMTTVPFVMYFNEHYRTRYPEIFAQYQMASQATRTRLLDQVSPTILDVLRVSSSSRLDVPTLASSARHPRPYILDRDTVSGDSRLLLEFDLDVGIEEGRFFGGTAQPTYISVINERFGSENTICYHRANTYAKALRAATVANCIEFDLVAEGDALLVYHPPTTSTGFTIEHMFGIAETRKTSLWIDSQNLGDPRACAALASYLEGNFSRVGQILVEFPSDVAERLAELEECGERIRSVARTSYYVPTEFLIPCAENPVENSTACVQLDEALRKVMASGIFSDLSFDFLGYPAMKSVDGASAFTWNTWAIKSEEFHQFPRHAFDFIIMNTGEDPNSY